jgi:3-oxoacyl-[acyl-carrier protein] reductase
MESTNPRIVVFGASGSIGQAICQHFAAKGWQVLAFSRQERAQEGKEPWLHWGDTPSATAQVELAVRKVDAIVWAQGKNCADSILDFDEVRHAQVYDANVLFVLRTLGALLKMNVLAPSARLCLISSIWQDIARPNKLSYCVSKSALRGLVQSAAIDLGAKGLLINAVLPGALDTPMTRANLTEGQISQLEITTPIGRLATLNDVCSAVDFLCSPSNVSITGQFVAVDGGFSHAKVL